MWWQVWPFPFHFRIRKNQIQVPQMQKHEGHPANHSFSSEDIKEELMTI
jgi:hypothetical protein